jgi:ABC-type polysaccharide/polyol phosphate transport system ATPase subunit
VRGEERICVDGLAVTLRRERHRVRSLREFAVGRVSGKRWGVEFVDVLRSVSLTVERGEIFGVLGANGAGKTTLLRVLAGIIPPSRGSVTVEGRIAPLIELGAGFDPELTGGENVFLYGSLLGMSRGEVRDGFERIVAFAELEEVMDVAVKNYSSGMIARLGFAVATACRPEVLLVDEVLAVGDARFRERCFDRIDALCAAGGSVVLVSHDLPMIDALASRAVLLENGCVAAAGEAKDVTRTVRQQGRGA